MAGDCFMFIDAQKIPDLYGESTDHAVGGDWTMGSSTQSKGTAGGWMEIHSFSFSTSQAVGSTNSMSGARSGQRCDISDVSVTKDLDRASPMIWLACCRGEHIDNVEIRCYRATNEAPASDEGWSAKDSGKTLYMRYLFKDNLITNYSPSGGAGLPMESISFNPGTVGLEYYPTDTASGGQGSRIPAQWSTISNRSGTDDIFSKGKPGYSRPKSNPAPETTGSGS